MAVDMLRCAGEMQMPGLALDFAFFLQTVFASQTAHSHLSALENSPLYFLCRGLGWSRFIFPLFLIFAAAHAKAKTD